MFGQSFHGFAEDDLDFLHRLPDLERIWFPEGVLRDVDGVYALGKVRKMVLPPKRPGVDFSRLSTLESLVWEHNPKDTGVASLARLQALHVWRYKPKRKTFDGLEIPSGVTELGIFFCNPRTLEGLPVLPHPRRLVIERCRNVESLAELPRVAPSLEYLVAPCRRISDGPEVVRHLPRLQHAFVRDRRLVSRDERP